MSISSSKKYVRVLLTKDEVSFVEKLISFRRLELTVSQFLSNVVRLYLYKESKVVNEVFEDV